MNLRIYFRQPRLLAGFGVLAVVLADRFLAWFFGVESPLFGVGANSADPLNIGLLTVWAIGHCDGMDGPVVTLAKKALDSSNVNLVLPWVREEDEAEIRRTFEHAMAVRKLDSKAKDLADRFFFETLVRVHRAGEGAPFIGLQPAGRDLGPAIPAADKALVDGSIDKVVTLLSDAIREGLHQHFHPAYERRKFDVNDVMAGREYVEAYVPYIHYVERLWDDAKGTTHGGEPAHAAHHH
ncbi:MAG: DUF6448 family protein [Polaromonas sp.]